MTTTTEPAGSAGDRQFTGMNPMWEAYERPCDGAMHIRVWKDGTFEPYLWDDWRRAAERTAVGLKRLGVEPGTRVACVLTNTFDVCATVLGAWLAGGVVLSLPTIRRGMSAEDYVDQLGGLVRKSGSPLLLLEDRFIELTRGRDLGAPVYSYDSLPADGSFDPTPPADDELAFVQYSSGSTSEPKGCMLSMGAIGAQELMLRDRLGVTGEDRGVSWLPLSHDMGLFGCVLLSWMAGMRLTLGSPERFLRKPRVWMDDCADMQATMSVSPNFGLALAARIAERTPPKGSFPMSRVILGGERIEMGTLLAATKVLGPYGITMETLVPAYGLAEGTLSVTMRYPGQTPTAIAIDQDAAYRGELKVVPAGEGAARELVSCGPPVRDVSVRTIPEEGVGRICVKSAALADGYLDDPEKTADRFRDGEYLTDDLGFIKDGELYVLGRVDDVIPIGGRNLHARDVELVVERCEGVRPGCCVMVDLPDEPLPRLLILAEPARDAPDLQGLAREMADAAYGAAGTRVAEIVFVEPGSLPKTPSGKIQRFRSRQLVTDASPAIKTRVEV